MMRLLKKFWRSIFKPKGYLLDAKYEIVPAFEWNGETYYMHKDPLNTLAGRGLTSLMFMEELLMRCDVSYLKEHTAATEAVINNPNGINIAQIIRLNNNLKERVNLLAAIPEHVYRMASVTFFTKNESPFRYDIKTGDEKVKIWKETPGMYDFFLQTPLKDLIPSLALPEASSNQYLMVLEKINELHLTHLQDLLYSNPSIAATLN